MRPFQHRVAPLRDVGFLKMQSLRSSKGDPLVTEMKGRSGGYSHTVYFPSKEAWDRVTVAAQGNVSAYIRDRIEYEDGYADPTIDLAVELSLLADRLSAKLHGIGDLVRATTVLRRIAEEQRGSTAIQSAADAINASAAALLSDHPHQADITHQLIAKIDAFVIACAERECRQQRAATTQKRHRKL